MRNVSEEIYRENQNKQFMFNSFFHKIVLFMRYCVKRVVGPGRPQMTVCLMRMACWKTKTKQTDTRNT